MITGHIVVAIAAKARWPRLSIALLLVATYFADIIESWLFWIGWPMKNADWGHALVFLIPMAVFAALVYGAIRRDYIGGGVIGGVLLSHWLLDAVTWMKPTWPHGPVIGLRLYDRPVLDFAIEVILIVATWAFARTRVRGLLADGRVYVALILLQIAGNVAGWRQHQMQVRENLPPAIPDISAAPFSPAAWAGSVRRTASA